MTTPSTPAAISRFLPTSRVSTGRSSCLLLGEILKVGEAPLQMRKKVRLVLLTNFWPGPQQPLLFFFLLVLFSHLTCFLLMLAHLQPCFSISISPEAHHHQRLSTCGRAKKNSTDGREKLPGILEHTLVSFPRF